MRAGLSPPAESLQTQQHAHSAKEAHQDARLGHGDWGRSIFRHGGLAHLHDAGGRKPGGLRAHQRTAEGEDADEERSERAGAPGTSRERHGVKLRKHLWPEMPGSATHESGRAFSGQTALGPRKISVHPPRGIPVQRAPAKATIVAIPSMPKKLLSPAVPQPSTRSRAGKAEARARAPASDALQRAKEELERRVNERTAELRKANRELKTQINARHRLESELLKVSERERRRFGQDLHDETCQGLAGLSLLARVIAGELEDASPAVKAKMTLLSEQLRSLMEQTRQIASGLHPVALSGGLASAFRELAARVHLRVPCKLSFEEAITLSEDEALAFYRIAQEATTNALRHAQASKIEISLKRLRSGIALTIRDDGVGLDTETLPPGSMGLDIMRCRAHSIGAEFTAKRGRHKGTQITCLLGSPPQSRRD